MSADIAAAIWRELLDGQWVVVDRRDASLVRTLVLRRSTEAERSSCAFTPLERALVGMAMRASSLKVMAAQVGLSTSRVADVLAKVRAKLGAPTHADLLRMMGSTGKEALASPPATASVPARAPGRPSMGEKLLPNRMVMLHPTRP